MSVCVYSSQVIHNCFSVFFSEISILEFDFIPVIYVTNSFSPRVCVVLLRGLLVVSSIEMLLTCNSYP